MTFDAPTSGDEGVLAFRRLPPASRFARSSPREDGEAVAHRQRLLLVVRDVNEGDPDLADRTLDPRSSICIPGEPSDRARPEAVEQEHLRVVDEGPCESNPLAAGRRES